MHANIQMHMRTTVELTEGQHAALVVVARRRGIRGFSQLVQEAIDAYLADLAVEEVDALLALEGSVSAGEESEVRDRIAGARTSWRVS